MSNISRLKIILLCVSIAGSVGCRSKEPAVPAKSETKTTEGPLLAPPQRQTAPVSGSADHAALPTEGEPNGKSRAGSAIAAPADAALAAQPTGGEPSGTTSDPATAAEKEMAKAAKIKANLASLSSADRTLAEKQKICPVSGESLGTMGPPKKISVAGRDVFICCPGCEEALNNDPAKYLAKIGLEPAK